MNPPTLIISICSRLTQAMMCSISINLFCHNISPIIETVTTASRQTQKSALALTNRGQFYRTDFITDYDCYSLYLDITLIEYILCIIGIE